MLQTLFSQHNTAFTGVVIHGGHAQGFGEASARLSEARRSLSEASVRLQKDFGDVFAGFGETSARLQQWFNYL